MFKFEVGQRVKIISNDTIAQGNIGIIEECRMSSGTIPIPRYLIRGNWYYENDLEAV
jgi:hypothetical protein